MMTRKALLGSLAVAAALAAILTVTARADQPDPAAAPATPAAPAAASSDQLATVVITATKRQTTVQNTPASITAVTSAEIADRGLTDFNSLAQSVPGISMRSSGPGQTEFEMRGLNSAGGNTSVVGFYLDETPLSSPASAQLGKVVIDPDLYDLNRVEVLHGPQGTLYGASSIGGTVRLVPNAPQLNNYTATAETVVSYTGDGGNINHEENGMLNLPLGDTAAVRVVGSITYNSGWIKRLVLADGAVAVDGPPGALTTEVSRPSNFYTAPILSTIDGANWTTVDSVRASVLWKPIDNLSITPMVMWQLTQQGAPNEVDVNGDPTHPQAPAVKAHWEIYDTSEPQRDRLTLLSLKAVYQLPTFSLTSATGFWNRGLVVSQDGTEEDDTAITPGGVYDANGTPTGGIGPTGPGPSAPGSEERDYTRQLTEELRLTSTTSGPLQWLIGYFYQDLESEWDLWVIGPQATPILGGPNIYVDYQPQTITQNAAFGELSWQFTPRLKATAGFRYYHYSLSQSNTEYGALTVNSAEGNYVPYNTTASNRANGTVPKVDVQYNITPDDMVYATVSKGFRLGGVNQPIPVAYATSTNLVLVGNECGLQLKLLNLTTCNPNLLLHAPSTFGSDSVWNYEAGVKSSFLDRRMTFDVTGYFEQWLHPQLATNLAGFGITANGASAHIKGLEAELRTLLGRNWDLTVNFGYTDATFTQDSAIIGYPAGYEVPDTPKFTASAILHWEQEVSSNLALFGTAEGDFVGTRTDAPYGETISLVNVNQFLIHLPSYELFNLRFGVNGDRWTAALFLNNITDKVVLLDPEPRSRATQ
jgi:iron complex outermembrane recepter protein